MIDDTLYLPRIALFTICDACCLSVSDVNEYKMNESSMWFYKTYYFIFYNVYTLKWNCMEEKSILNIDCWFNE